MIRYFTHLTAESDELSPLSGRGGGFAVGPCGTRIWGLSGTVVGEWQAASCGNDLGCRQWVWEGSTDWIGDPIAPSKATLPLRRNTPHAILQSCVRTTKAPNRLPETVHLPVLRQAVDPVRAAQSAVAIEVR